LLPDGEASQKLFGFRFTTVMFPIMSARLLVVVTGARAVTVAPVAGGDGQPVDSADTANLS